MGTAETYRTTKTQLERTTWLSRCDPTKQFNCLVHYFNEASLKECFHELGGKKAVGVDGINKSEYAASLEDNLKSLVERMKRMSYRPQMIRQVLIPKERRGQYRYKPEYVLLPPIRKKASLSLNESI